MKDFLEAQVSEATKRNYRFGLETFAKWYKKPIQEILSEDDPGKTLEKYWVWLKKTYRGNTPRNKLNIIVQYCKFNNVTPNIRKGLHVNKQLESVRDHPLTVDEARQMYQVGSLEDKILVKTWLLGIRNKDARNLKWKDFDFGEGSEELKKVVIRTKKEGIPAELYLDNEFQRLLVKYIPTLDKDNPFLLQSNKGGKLSSKQLLRKIHNLRKKAGIEVTKGKVFGWHNARYLRSRIGTELDINKTALQKMIGQATGVFGRYAKHSDIRKAAKKLSKALRMEPKKETNKEGNLAESLAKLKEGLLAIVEMISVTEQSVASFKKEPKKTINLYEMSDDELLEWFIKTYGRKKRRKKD